MKENEVIFYWLNIRPVPRIFKVRAMETIASGSGRKGYEMLEDSPCLGGAGGVYYEDENCGTDKAKLLDYALKQSRKLINQYLNHISDIQKFTNTAKQELT